MSSLHVILPVQYLRSAEAGLATPQKRLMLAVLQTVLHDCEAPAVGGTSEGRRAQAQAIAYVESRDRTWPFSFDNICEAIGLDAGGIRRALRHRFGDVA